MKLAIRITIDEQGGFTAICPALPGCICGGETREEATTKLHETIRGYLAAVSNFVPEIIVHQETAPGGPEPSSHTISFVARGHLPPVDRTHEPDRARCPIPTEPLEGNT